MGIIQSKFKSNRKNNSFRKISEEIRESEENNRTSQETVSSASLTASLPPIKFPSVSQDIDYLHHHHFVVKSIWSTNFSSPIEDSLINGATVLDVWCGPGTFLLELSNEYPLSEFIGMDCTKLFPISIKPNNLNFINANILEGLPFHENRFDFTHLNIVEPRYSSEQFNFIIDELTRVTKPGGYVEVQGFDSLGSKNIGPNFLKFLQKFAALFASYGNGARMGARSDIKSFLSANPYLSTTIFDSRRIQLGKNGGNLGVILEKHTKMFFIDIMGELLADASNISIDVLKQDWKEVQEEFNEAGTSFETYRMWAMKV